jgi:hypothetical protein
MAFSPIARCRAGWLTVFALWIPAPVVLALAPVCPVHAQEKGEDVEAAAKSRLTGIPLDNALRLTGGSEMAEIRKQLDAALTQANAKRGADEMLIWISPAYTGPASAKPIIETVAKRLKEAGYQYEAPDTGGKEEDGALIIASRGAAELYAGLWLKTDQLLMLAWCRVEKAGNAPSTPAPEGNTVTPPATVKRGLDTSKVIVPGEPVLTQQMIDETCEFLAFLMDSPLNVEQKAKLAASITADWKKRDKGTIELVKEFTSYRAQIFPKPEAERDLIRKQLQPPILKALREHKHDEGAKWMLGIYEAAHKPIASGDPPLTRQMTDAYTEVFFFMGSEVLGEKMTPDAKAKDAMAKGLASGYAKAPAAAKKQLNQMPLIWAAIRVAWPTLPEAQKQAAREQWRKDFKAILPVPKQAATKSPTASRTKAGSSTNSASSSEDLRKKMAAMQAMQSAYQMRSNMMWQNHYSQMNTINTWGGNPYRYVNSWGRPY